MATTQKRATAPVQAAIAQYLPLEKTLRDAWKLAQRFRDAEGFRTYLRRRLPLVIPAVALFVLVSIACAAATVIYLADVHALLALPGLILAPFVLAGSLFVQVYVFFGWLENRALAHALRRHKPGNFDFGQLPRVPWLLAVLFLVVPFMVLWAVSTGTGLVLILLGIAVVMVFARFDR